MALDRAVADPELLRDLFVGPAAGHPDEYLALPAGELVEDAGALAAHLAAHHGAELAGYGRAEERLAAAHRPDGRAQLGGGAVLEQVPVHPGAQALEHVLRIVVHAQYEDARLGRAPAELR